MGLAVTKESRDRIVFDRLVMVGKESQHLAAVTCPKPSFAIFRIARFPFPGAFAVWVTHGRRLYQRLFLSCGWWTVEDGRGLPNLSFGRARVGYGWEHKTGSEPFRVSLFRLFGVHTEEGVALS